MATWRPSAAAEELEDDESVAMRVGAPLPPCSSVRVLYWKATHSHADHVLETSCVISPSYISTQKRIS